MKIRKLDSTVSSLIHRRFRSSHSQLRRNPGPYGAEYSLRQNGQDQTVLDRAEFTS